MYRIVQVGSSRARARIGRERAGRAGVSWPYFAVFIGAGSTGRRGSGPVSWPLPPWNGLLLLRWEVR